MRRNRRAEQQAGRPPPPNSVIRLPFIIVNTSKRTVIDCSISNDKYVRAPYRRSWPRLGCPCPLSSRRAALLIEKPRWSGQLRGGRAVRPGGPQVGAGASGPCCPLSRCAPTAAPSCRFEYLFNFDNTFEIHDDMEVLKRMGMACGLESGSCSAEDLKTARSLVPKALEPYVTGQGRPARGQPQSWVRAPSHGRWPPC